MISNGCVGAATDARPDYDDSLDVAVHTLFDDIDVCVDPERWGRAWSSSQGRLTHCGRWVRCSRFSTGPGD
jgi:hypothetical protein